MMHFAAKRKAARKEAGLTQKQAAERLGFSQSAIRQYEQGQSRPSYERLIDMCRLYGVSADALLGLDP